MSARGPSIAAAIVASVLLMSWASPLTAQWSRRPYAASRYGGNYMHSYHFGAAPSSTPAAPEWSPDGRSLAVSLSGSIWKVDVATGAAEELTASATYHTAPSWSPDGRWIAYTADDGGKSIQIEVLDLQTMQTRALTSDAANFVDPTFSPDGSRLAYTASLPSGFFNVFVRGIRGGQWASDPVQVTMDGSLGRDRPYFTAQDMHITPTWLPGGGELLLVSNRGVALGSGGIVRVPAENGGLAKAAVVVDEQTLYQARPDVSPDGSQVVYVSSRGGTQPWNELALRTLNGNAAGSSRVSGAAPSAGGTPSRDVFSPKWSPDGRTIAYLSNENGLPELALLDVATGQSRLLHITSRAWKRPAGTLRLRITEKGRSSPVPARVHLTASDGRFYAPPSAYARLSWAGDRVYHSDGNDSIEVPAGKVVIDVVRGFETEPAHIEAEIDPGQTRELTVTLSRIADLAADGWYSGSTGAHMHGGGLMRYSQEALLFQAAAEDLAVVNNALAHKEPRIGPDELFKWGRPAHALSTPDRLLILGQEYRPPFHGHVAVFGDPTPIDGLFPVTIGYEAAPPPTLAPSNSSLLRQAKARGALTSYVHAFSGETDPMQSALGLGKAFMVDAALGLADTIEWASASRGAFVPWYAALNNGLKVVAIGGEDTISNLHIMRLLGCVRTYVQTGRDGLTATGWWNGVREGRAFVTTGPLLGLTVNGGMAGDEIELGPEGGTVEVRGWVKSITPLQRLTLVRNGEVVEEIPLTGERRSAEFSRSIPVARSGWIHLRAEGAPVDRFPLDALYAQAFTNPIWLSVGGRPVRDRASAEYALKWIDMLQLMADAWPGWESRDEKAAVFADFDAARAVFRKLASEAPEPTNPVARIEDGGR
jgi:TolB protein